MEPFRIHRSGLEAVTQAALVGLGAVIRGAHAPAAVLRTSLANSSDPLWPYQVGTVIPEEDRSLSGGTNSQRSDIKEAKSREF